VVSGEPDQIVGDAVCRLFLEEHVREESISRSLDLSSAQALLADLFHEGKSVFDRLRGLAGKRGHAEHPDSALTKGLVLAPYIEHHLTPKLKLQSGFGSMPLSKSSGQNV
jgi:hypothetical protein